MAGRDRKKQSRSDRKESVQAKFSPVSSLQARAVQMIPTVGIALNDGSLVEVVRRNNNELCLFGPRGPSKWGSTIEHDGTAYAVSAGANLIRHLPSKPQAYYSTEKLFRALCEFITSCTAVSEREASLLTFIAFASYFSDCLSTSPCLLLFGAPFSSVSLLRVLGCICRHSILSVRSSLEGLPLELRPTRLIFQPDIRVDRQLAALQLSGFGVFAARARVLTGTTVIYVGDAELQNPLADLSIQMWLSDSTRSFGTPEEERAANTINHLQNMLLNYRVQNYPKVKISDFDVPTFRGATREYARMLGRCVVDAPGLQSLLEGLLQGQNDAEYTESASVLDAVILEAMTVACHERRTSIHVAEVATLANAILTRSGETIELSNKQVGGRMRKLGFRTTKLDASGRGVHLLNGECARIHHLGRSMGIPTLTNGLEGCAYCQRNR